MFAVSPIFVDPFKLTEPLPAPYNPCFTDTTGRVEDASDPGGRTLTLLVLGQSNASNWSNGAYTPASPNVRQVNIFDGKMYRMKDPMLGVDGTVGSWIGRLGQQLIDEAMVNRVVFFNIAIGGAPIADFSTRGVLHHRLAVAIRIARRLGLTIDAGMTMIGETDTILGNSQASFVGSALDTFAGAAGVGFAGPWLIAQCTGGGLLPSNAVPIRAAQAALVNPALGRYAGPDTDTLGASFRYDSLHLNATTGGAAVTMLWRDAIRAVFG